MKTKHSCSVQGSRNLLAGEKTTQSVEYVVNAVICTQAVKSKLGHCC